MTKTNTIMKEALQLGFCEIGIAVCGATIAICAVKTIDFVAPKICKGAKFIFNKVKDKLHKDSWLDDFDYDDDDLDFSEYEEM